MVLFLFFVDNIIYRFAFSTRYKRMDFVSVNSGDEIYHLVDSAHHITELKQAIAEMQTKSADDTHLQTLLSYIDRDIIALLEPGMAEHHLSWNDYIFKDSRIAYKLLAPHVARFLAIMRSIEHQYVLMRRLCDMERKYAANDIGGVIVCEEPVLVAFSSFPEGIHGDRDDLDLVVVYNSDNWDASSAVDRIDRLGYHDRPIKDNDGDWNKHGVVKNPEMYGMTGKNIKWAGIYHS